MGQQATTTQGDAARCEEKQQVRDTQETTQMFHASTADDPCSLFGTFCGEKPSNSHFWVFEYPVVARRWKISVDNHPTWHCSKKDTWDFYRFPTTSESISCFSSSSWTFAASRRALLHHRYPMETVWRWDNPPTWMFIISDPNMSLEATETGQKLLAWLRTSNAHKHVWLMLLSLSIPLDSMLLSLSQIPPILRRV